MNYENRLLNSLSILNSGSWTADDFASLWKRSKQEVRLAAKALAKRKRITIGQFGALSLREGIGGA